MTGELFDLALRAKAITEQHAVLGRSTLPVRIRPDAFMITTVAMPGEHAGIWGITAGRYDQFDTSNTMTVCADPRDRRQQIRLWTRFGAALNRHMAWCDSRNVAPQIIVANRRTLDLLEASAEWVVTVPGDDPDTVTVREAAENLLFLTNRAGYPGTQTVIAAADVLRDVIVTGGDITDEPCLGVLLAWLHPDTTTLTERTTTAVTHDRDDCFLPEDNDTAAAKILRRYLNNQFKVRTEDRAQLVTATEAEFTGLFRTLITERAARLTAAIQAITGLGLPVLDAVTHLEEDDLGAWQRHRTRQTNRAPEQRLGRNDTPAVAAVKLLTREETAQNWNAALIWSDDLYRHRCEADGTVIRGDTQPAGPNRTEVTTTHPAPRIRVGEDLYAFDDPDTPLQIETSRRDGKVTRLTVAGSLAASTVVLCPSPPNWQRSKRRVLQATRRIRTGPWTHRTVVQATALPGLNRLVPDQLVEQIDILGSATRYQDAEAGTSRIVPRLTQS